MRLCDQHLIVDNSLFHFLRQAELPNEYTTQTTILSFWTWYKQLCQAYHILLSKRQRTLSTSRIATITDAIYHVDEINNFIEESTKT